MATLIPAQTAKIFVLYCKKTRVKMALSRNGRFLDVRLTFRNTLNEENLQFYPVEDQNFLCLW